MSSVVDTLNVQHLVRCHGGQQNADLRGRERGPRAKVWSYPVQRWQVKMWEPRADLKQHHVEEERMLCLCPGWCCQQQGWGAGRQWCPAAKARKCVQERGSGQQPQLLSADHVGLELKRLDLTLKVRGGCERPAPGAWRGQSQTEGGGG